MTPPLSFGSLFSGIGGFDLGLEQAGMSCAWQVEIDAACRLVLALHWPLVPRLEDVSHVRLADLPTPVDLICGGFPCQDLSVAGRRAGLAGERSGLWFKFHRILAEARPRWCIIENVPGLLSSNGGRDFAVILRGLEQLGYHAAWRILDAQYFGVPQRRRRVFIVGSLGDYASLEVLLEPKGLSGDPPPRRETGQEVAGTFGGSSQSGGFRATDLDNSGAFIFESRFARNDRGGPDVIVPPLKAQSGQSGKGDGAPLLVARPLAYSRTSDHFDESQQTYVIAGTVTGAEAHNGNSNPIPENLVVAGGGKPGQGYPAALTGGQVRRLTPTECERLQGFPDGWTAGHSDSSRYRMLGNAVCVPVAEWIGRRILP